MSNTKAINANHALYKLQDNANTFVANAFPLRRFVRSTLDRKYKTEKAQQLSPTSN